MRFIIILAVLLSALSTPAQAQQEPKVGITMGYPAAVGILWHLSEGVAIRPDLNVSQASSKSEASTVTGDSWTYGVGVSALMYVSRADNLRTYVSPRFTYSHSSNTTSVSALVSTTGTTEVNGYQVAGSFGAQYALHGRFSVYGEAGFGYAWTDSTFTSAVSSGQTTTRAWATRTALGVVLYFD